jgi:ATP-dependent protease ClpP protease subunit
MDIGGTFMPLRIEAKANNTAEIIIYAPIGASFWEESITAKQFFDELKAIPDNVKEIVIRVNSPGGDVFDGIAIYNLIKQKKGRKVCIVDGIAASIASIIAMAADEVIMSDGTQMMVHKPWTMTMGNSDDLEKTIQRLDDIEEQMISIYRNKTKLDRAEIRDLLRNETWMDAETAVAKGFANKTMVDGVKIAASMDKASWIKHKPKLENKLFKSEVSNLKSQISEFLNKKK